MSDEGNILDSADLKAAIFLESSKLIKRAYRGTGRHPDFEEILTLAAWILQGEPSGPPEKPKFGFHGGSYAELDFPEGEVDPMGLGDDEDDYEDDD